MSSGFRFAPGGRERLLLLEQILDSEYRAPEAILGNQLNVLDEVIYIILSFQTNLLRFQETWRSLRSAFPRWEDANRATVDEIAGVLRAGGLHRQKGKAIKRVLRAVDDEFGELSLDVLRELTDVGAERVLTRLPGLSWKGARCVLLYSLQRDVFPVDGNTFRILLRTGVVPESAVYRRRRLHDALQAAVPAGRRRAFHVNLVVHGQRVCRPVAPKCGTCAVYENCPRRGLAALRMKPTNKAAAPRTEVGSSIAKGQQVAAPKRHRSRSPVPSAKQAGAVV